MGTLPSTSIRTGTTTTSARYLDDGTLDIDTRNLGIADWAYTSWVARGIAAGSTVEPPQHTTATGEGEVVHPGGGMESSQIPATGTAIPTVMTSRVAGMVAHLQVRERSGPGKSETSDSGIRQIQVPAPGEYAIRYVPGKAMHL